jgi:trk system potassium uptake protein TrkH
VVIASEMFDLRPVLFILGMVLTHFGAAMLLPAIVDAAVGNPDWQVFAASGAVTVFTGGLLLLGNRGAVELGLRQAFILTTACWVTLSFFGALPLMLSALPIGFTDAFFESMSGLTTTGSTVLVGLDQLPPGILLWRALLQWIGGIGIIVMGIAILPFLRVGGMQLFRAESSDRSDKPLPRLRQVAGTITAAYDLLTLACAFLYALAGMSAFEAVTHAMTTLSTGGYSTSDGSIGHFDSPPIDWIAVAFMLAGSIPFVLYVRMFHNEPMAILRNSQVRALLVFLAGLIAAFTLWLWAVQPVSLADALRLVTFNVVSIVTTTGYATTDYSLWGSTAVIIFLALTVVGGCTGSTAGGIKIMRFEVMILTARAQAQRLIHPHQVAALTYNQAPLTSDVQISVAVFSTLFFVSIAVGTVALDALGLDFMTSLSAAATAVANVGPGLGGMVGPAGNFAGLPDAAKWLLALGMLVGRLELFTVLILLSPGFWRV